MGIRRMFPVNPKPGQRSQLWTIMDEVGQYLEDALGQPMVFSRAEAVRITRGETAQSVLESREGKSVTDIAGAEVAGKQRAAREGKERKLRALKAIADKRLGDRAAEYEEIVTKPKRGKAGN